MVAVSSSIPLIVFAAIGRFQLLRDVFSEILIPPRVWEVVVDLGGGRPGTREVADAAWIQVREPADSRIITLLSRDMDRTEAEAIALGFEMPGGTTVILDRLEARQAASSRGLVVTGSAGVLLRAKELGYIDQVRPLLDKFRPAGLFLSDAVIRQVLDAADEL